MSLTNAQAWLEKVRTDPDLHAKIRELAPEQPDRILDALVAAGAEAGYAFGKEDLLQAAKEAVSSAAGSPDELDEEQLELVAGGDDTILYVLGSIITAGIGCAMLGLKHAIKGS